MSMPNTATGAARLTPELIAQLRPLRLRAARIVEGYVAGLHRSPFQGFSNQFAQHREYVPGDDLRYVDWKVFGKSDKVYLKQYEEETNLIAQLVLDTSESMSYRSDAAPWSKLEYAQTVVAALAYLVLHQQDAVGFASFDTSVRRVLRPSASPTQLTSVLAALEQTAAREKTSLGPILHDLAERFTKRGIVVLLSDFFDDVASTLAGLKHFHHRRHDLIVMQVVDPAELDFPFEQATLFRGLEAAGELLVEPARLRAAYRQEFTHFTTELATGCRSLGADYVLLRTDESPEGALTALLARRARRSL